MNRPSSHSPRPAFRVPVAQPITGQKVKKASIFTVGSFVQLLGLCCLVFGVPGFVACVILLVLGGRLARGYRCGRCGTTLASRDVVVCPGCRCTFTN